MARSCPAHPRNRSVKVFWQVRRSAELPKEAAQKADSFIVLGQDLDHGMNFTAFHLGYAGRGGNGLMWFCLTRENARRGWNMVKLLDSMLSWKNLCETASTPRCAKALSPPVEGIFEKIDSEWCTPIGLPFSEARRGCDVGYIYEGTRQQVKNQDSVCISWPEDSQFSCFPCTDDPR